MPTNTTCSFLATTRPSTRTRIALGRLSGVGPLVGDLSLHPYNAKSSMESAIVYWSRNHPRDRGTTVRVMQ